MDVKGKEGNYFCVREIFWGSLHHATFFFNGKRIMYVLHNIWDVDVDVMVIIQEKYKS